MVDDEKFGLGAAPNGAIAQSEALLGDWMAMTRDAIRASESGDRALLGQRLEDRVALAPEMDRISAVVRRALRANPSVGLPRGLWMAMIEARELELEIAKVAVARRQSTGADAGGIPLHGRSLIATR